MNTRLANDLTTLQSTVDAVHHAGMPGLQVAVRHGEQVWCGAAGVADLDTGRPITPEMRQRVGSITKTFTAAAILQQVEQGMLGLDVPIGSYLPEIVPGERGERVTVRMLLNHTSGFAEYLPHAFPSFAGFPSLAGISPDSIDDNRFRRFDPVELVEMGLATPGVPGWYSNTNYRLLGLLLEQVIGRPAEEYITENVIARAGLEHTAFPAGPRIDGPHSRMYEALYGLIDPPRDYSVYDPSWVGPAAGLVSTVADLNRFFARLLFSDTIVAASSLAQMRRTVPVVALDGQTIDYGLGLHRFDIPGVGELWGNDGTVWGAATISLAGLDGTRQLSVALNLARWNRPDASGRPAPHPIDGALLALYRQALGGR